MPLIVFNILKWGHPVADRDPEWPHCYSIYNCRKWKIYRTSIRRAQSKVICNKSTTDCAWFLVQNEIAIDVSFWQAQSAVMYNRRGCLRGAIGGNFINILLLPKNFMPNHSIQLSIKRFNFTIKIFKFRRKTIFYG